MSTKPSNRITFGFIVVGVGCVLYSLAGCNALGLDTPEKQQAAAGIVDATGNALAVSGNPVTMAAGTLILAVAGVLKVAKYFKTQVDTLGVPTVPPTTPGTSS